MAAIATSSFTPGRVSGDGGISSNGDISSIPTPPQEDGENTGRLRRHAGNVPTLPQTKQCPHCPAKFTRSTHLNRHLKTHSSERPHKCEECNAGFTRSDLLSRHRKTCNGVSRVRPKVEPTNDPPSTETWRELDHHRAGDSSASASTATDDLSSVMSFHTANSASANNSLPTLYSDSSSVFDSLFSGIFSQPTPSAERNQMWAGRDVTSDYPTPVSQYGSDGSPNPLFTLPSALQGSSGQPLSVDGSLPEASFTDLLFTFGEFNQATPTLRTQGLPPITDNLAPLSSNGSYPAQVVSPDEPTAEELENYMSMFFLSFSPQMPILHVPTWTVEGKPPILLAAMRAAGALYVRTSRAAAFILNTLESARTTLLVDLAKGGGTLPERTNLILATVILQFIGLFHQEAEVRASHNIFHGVLVQMIRTRGLLSQSAAYEAPELKDPALTESAWQEWAIFETLKRVLYMAWILDCCHVIYFGLPGSFITNEFTLNLPCEDGLFIAPSSKDWLREIAKPSPYGVAEYRIRGFPLQKALLTIADSKKLEMVCQHILMNANAHWILIHTALRNVFSLCPLPDANRQWVEWKKKMRASNAPGDAARKAMANEQPDDVPQTEVLQAQYVLYNWLSSYLRAPEVIASEGKELPYMADALPYYWLGQVSLMALQEGLPPFVRDKPTDTTQHFLLVKHWLRHVRLFLRKSKNKQSTLLWNEMMKIRLQSGTSSAAAEADEGLLGLFPEGVGDFWGPLQYRFGS